MRVGLDFTAGAMLAHRDPRNTNKYSSRSTVRLRNRCTNCTGRPNGSHGPSSCRLGLQGKEQYCSRSEKWPELSLSGQPEPCQLVQPWPCMTQSDHFSIISDDNDRTAQVNCTSLH